MAIIWDNVVAIAPELSATPLQAQTDILADVAISVSAETMGDRFDMACKWLAAHMATMTMRRGVIGAQTGETVGPLSQNWAPPSGSAIGYMSTSYGQEYVRILKSRAATRMMVI